MKHPVAFWVVWGAILLSAPELDAVVAQAPNDSVAPLALTISGGGFKGAYMAGHLFYMGHANRLGGDRFQPRVFTGTSAGALNGLAALFTACTGNESDPTRSLYWDAWIPVGVNELFVPAEMTSTGMLTTVAYEPTVDRLRAIWDAGFPEGCDLLLGVTVTRAIARSVVLAPGFPPLPRSRESVLLRITGRGSGQPPVVHNVVDPAWPGPQVLLPLDGPDVDSFNAIQQLIFASAAVPFAFAPVNLAHCLSDSNAPSLCTPENAQEALFFDGSIFDSRPLGLALRAAHLVDADDATSSGTGASGRNDVPPNMRFYYLDPRALAYPSVPMERDDGVPEDAVGIARLILGMVESNESGELVSVFADYPAMRDRILVARTFFPHISNAFTGVIERQFRQFDFYLGMYNAARTVREHRLGVGVPDIETELLQTADSSLRDAWRPFSCLRAVLDGVGNVDVCGGADLVDFRILLQVSLDIVFDECRRAGEAGLTAEAIEHPRCREAMTGAEATLVPGVNQLDDDDRRRRDDEDPLDYRLRLLGLYGFHFEDLGLERNEARHARTQLTRLSHRIVHDFARAQTSDQTALAILGRIGIDVALGYVPPRHSFHLNLGLGGEFGYSATLNERNLQWFRLGVALGFDGLSSVFSSADTYLVLTPKAGPEIEVFGRAAAQVRLGTRVGYQFSTVDSFGSSACDPATAAVSPCTRLMTELYVSTSVLGVVRLQVAGVFEPAIGDNPKNLFSLRPMIGIQFNSPF